MINKSIKSKRNVLGLCFPAFALDSKVKLCHCQLAKCFIWITLIQRNSFRNLFKAKLLVDYTFSSIIKHCTVLMWSTHSVSRLLCSIIHLTNGWIQANGGLQRDKSFLCIVEGRRTGSSSTHGWLGTAESRAQGMLKAAHWQLSETHFQVLWQIFEDEGVDR